MSDQLTVVGIGADGWSGLTPAGRSAIEAAEVLIGSARQLDLVPSGDALKVPWPSPLLLALPGLLEEHEGRRICVLASGDPTYHGIAKTLIKLRGADGVRVVPHLSSITLACARLGWAQNEVAVVSLVGRPVELLYPHLQPGRRLLALSADGRTPAAVAKALSERGYGGSAMTVLEQLGSDAERVVPGLARSWPDADSDPLNVIAVECTVDPDVTLLPAVPGLPDGAYENDGQLTKREVRAVALSRLAPVPGQLLWDVGGGAGSIAIEWMRTHPTCRALAVERDPDRAERITRNAAELGVPTLRVVTAEAPEALADLEPPDAIFIGGGGSDSALIDRCWRSLRPGGRLVVSAVTVETEAVLADWYRRTGGDLVRIGIQRAAALGDMTGWRPAMPVTVRSAVR